MSWERSLERLEQAWRTPASGRKAASGRPSWDAVLMFKALVMGCLNILSDENLALELRCDLPLMCFIGVNSNTGVPSAKTLRTCLDALSEAIEGLFAEFNERLAEAGQAATEGHIVDSTTVKAPVQRNSRDENKTIKPGRGRRRRKCGECRQACNPGSPGLQVWRPGRIR